MPAYNFQQRFAPLVESGQKQQTIRQTAKGAKRGATAYLYTGQRTVNCRKLGEGTITDVLPIEIGRHACSELYASITEYDGKRSHLAHEQLDSLARADGFANKEEMAEWFSAQHGLPFTGYLHQWRLSTSEDRGFKLPLESAMKRKSRNAAWLPVPGNYANYAGPKAGRRGHLLEIMAEASGRRMVVRGIGRAGRPVQFTVLAKNLIQPQPQLF